MKLIRIAVLVLLCSSARAEEGFVDLFNGKNLDGWMVVPENPKVWTVNKGELARKVQSSYLWTEKQYGDFVLELEFKVTPGCNSGLFFRTDPKSPVQGGFELQIMDSHGKKELGKHDCGALYDAKPAMVNAVKPVGEWNKMRVELKGPKLVAYLNGEKIQDLSLDDWTTPKMNPDGSENKFEKALKDLPRTGHIGFQDHGHDVFYRNIRIKE
ncbi:DUF1080 domain-containing protein [Phragmitibacter flavus]|uniref:DUF1080 domain-containing protein n=1 Tax=Phragmitibacter flavus TaxID=2576071 RepID=A0A5R8K9P5_9BACT|nr:DUF1080 domain-containing protein [Phragmitibacter flavus]TLD69028.1 DUF1080 domain-containing protein [Phragmitibacter flavus]